MGDLGYAENKKLNDCTSFEILFYFRFLVDFIIVFILGEIVSVYHLYFGILWLNGVYNYLLEKKSYVRTIPS